MKHYAFIRENNLIGVGQARILNEDIQNIEISEELFNAYREDNDKYVYLDGEFVLNPDYDKKIEAQALAQAKAERADAVSKIIVEVDGMQFDGDEESQQRVARSIIALEEGETMPWVLYDNTIAEVTKEQLKQVLRLAGQKQSELWVIPYLN